MSQKLKKSMLRIDKKRLAEHHFMFFILFHTNKKPDSNFIHFENTKHLMSFKFYSLF